MAPDSSAAKDKKIVVVGGGLVGALCACFLARRGLRVELYESRKDPRTQEFVKGRSVNLALSVRGLNALQAINAEGPVVSTAIPMHSRMIHSLNGSRNPQLYGKKGQYIMSVERRRMNEHLLTVAENNPLVKLKFEHKLLSIDLDRSNLTFRGPRGETVQVDDGDLIIGCDGAYSAIRKEMIKIPRYDYNQTYIGHGYKELCLPATLTGEHKMETNCLHIWPRNEFMMIALPNQDGSFTCTLFMPFDFFDEIKTKDDLLKFFYEQYPDFVPLMGDLDGSPSKDVACEAIDCLNSESLTLYLSGLEDIEENSSFPPKIGEIALIPTLVKFALVLYPERSILDCVVLLGHEETQLLRLIHRERLIDEYFRNPVGPMVSIKCNPYHVGNKVLILGDASHAMVPFYGQGMNCGFEDCFVFNELLNKHDNNFAATLKEYSRIRNPDVEAMCDLAMYNYIEMRALVNSPLFLLKKKLFNVLHWLMPKTFIPLYTMVTFSHIPYHTVVERSKWQDKIVKRAFLSMMVLLSGVGSLVVLQRWKS